MKFLIAGLGSAGRRHLHNLLRLGERDIILYRTFKSTLPNDELREFPVETDIQAALRHRPQAAIISNPTAYHLDVAIPLAHAGCHLLIEKPISHTLQGLAQLREALQAGGGKAMIGYHFRFHPLFCLTKRLLDEGKIGRPLSVHAHYGDYLPGWHPWEDFRCGYSARGDLGGGITGTLSHPLDYLLWFFGAGELLWKVENKISDLGIEVNDAAELGIRFASGMIGSIHLDYYQRLPAHHFEIVGTAGTIRWDAADNKLHVYAAAAEAWEEIAAPDNFERNDIFMAEMAHFLRLVRGEAEPGCGLDEGERVLRLAIAPDYPLGGTCDKYWRRPLPEKISLVVFDFDGVMTDNRVWVSEMGHEQVVVNRSDGLGIALLRRSNIETMVLSTEMNPVVAVRCKKLKIPFRQGIADKGAVLKQFLQDRQIEPARVIYVGNDVNDLSCFQLAGFTIVPADAHDSVRGCADMVLRAGGGKGAVREVCDLVVKTYCKAAGNEEAQND